jgi:arylamine N-acetyltransferase
VDYFDRIGVPRPAVPDLAGLRAVVAGHARTIAFENLDAFTGTTPDLDPAALTAKLVDGRRGGWCFEQNALLRDALTGLGFTVTALGARVRAGLPPGAPPTPRGHMLLLVELPEGPHVVDVGFGGLTLTGALALVPDVEQETPHEVFRLVEQDGGYLEQALAGGVWRDLYWFDLTPMLPVDHGVPNWYLANHPRSHFVTGLTAARPDPDRRWALGGRTLSVHHLGGPTERRDLDGPRAVRDALEERMQLDISGVAGLDERLARLF